MSIREIQQALIDGQSKFNKTLVKIHQDKNNRYFAYVTTPKINTMVTTPDLIKPETLKEFCLRLAQDLVFYKWI